MIPHLLSRTLLISFLSVKLAAVQDGKVDIRNPRSKQQDSSAHCECIAAN